jgi:hypothetical protein
MAPHSRVLIRMSFSLQETRVMVHDHSFQEDFIPHNPDSSKNSVQETVREFVHALICGSLMRCIPTFDRHPSPCSTTSVMGVSSSITSTLSWWRCSILGWGLWLSSKYWGTFAPFLNSFYFRSVVCSCYDAYLTLPLRVIVKRLVWSWLTGMILVIMGWWYSQLFSISYTNHEHIFHMICTGHPLPSNVHT